MRFEIERTHTVPTSRTSWLRRQVGDVMQERCPRDGGRLHVEVEPEAAWLVCPGCGRGYRPRRVPLRMVTRDVYGGGGRTHRLRVRCPRLEVLMHRLFVLPFGTLVAAWFLSWWAFRPVVIWWSWSETDNEFVLRYRGLWLGEEQRDLMQLYLDTANEKLPPEAMCVYAPAASLRMLAGLALLPAVIWNAANVLSRLWP